MLIRLPKSLTVESLPLLSTDQIPAEIPSAAKSYLERRLSIIPIKGRHGLSVDDSKRPFEKWREFQDRSPLMQEVAAWFPPQTKKDVAIVTGPISGVIVIDVDGEEGLLSMARKAFPKTWISKTPRGFHLFFKWTDELDAYVTTKTDVLRKVDVRGKGGYVIAPPSTGFNGERPYRWLRGHSPNDLPLALPPKWLIEELRLKRSDLGSDIELKGGRHWLVAALSNLREGNRDATVARITGKLHQKGISADEIVTLLEPHLLRVGKSKTRGNFTQNDLRKEVHGICQR